MDDETTLKAQGAASIVGMLTGYDPVIVEKPEGGALIAFKEADQKAVTALIERTIKTAMSPSAGGISFDVLPVLSPLAFKYLFPAILVLVLLGALGGYFVGSSK